MACRDIENVRRGSGIACCLVFGDMLDCEDHWGGCRTKREVGGIWPEVVAKTRM
jgi:hypothetical protein